MLLYSYGGAVFCITMKVQCCDISIEEQYCDIPM